MIIQRFLNKSVFQTKSILKTVPAIQKLNFSSKSGDDNWSQIYKLPQIKLLAGFNKLKIYQAVISGALIPASLALEQAGSLPQNISTVVATLAGTGFVTLCLGSIALKNIVGILYVNEEGTKLKVSCPDFWGRRKDHTIVIDNMIAPSNFTKFKYNPSLIITTDEKGEKFRLLADFGEIVEPDTYFTLFGKN